MDKEKKLIAAALKTEKFNFFWNNWFGFPSKSIKESIEARQQGNKLYVSKEHNALVHYRIWQLYTMSIAKVPSGDPNSLEELARAYGNRSALLQHIGKVKESIDDIDRALKLTKSHALKTKLLNRKIKCKTVLEKSNRQNFEDQNHSVNGMQEIDNEHKSKTVTKNLLFETEVEDVFEKIYLKYSEQYGRHMMAKRDIKPGEIIMCIEPYVSVIDVRNLHTFCDHCMKISWASIPCDYCDLCMFCSEECKNEAWKKYHDVECQVLPHINNHPESINRMNFQLSLRLTIMAIREAGNITKLEEELKKVDTTQSKLHKGFVNGKFHNNKFQSIYSLSNNVVSRNLQYYIDQSVFILIDLAKATSFFGKNYKLETKQDFLQNRDVIFIGSLLLKFISICDINAYLVSKESNLCKYLHNEKSQTNNQCCEIEACIAGISSFFNHSCYPNVRRCFTKDNKIILYAIQPIKKNTQLFDSYIDYYCNIPKEKRQLLLQKYNMNCSCPPCKEGWPTISLKETQVFNHFMQKIGGNEKNLMEKCNILLNFIKGDYKNCVLSSIEYLTKCITETVTDLHQPSCVTLLLMDTLCSIIDNVYRCKFQITDECFS